MENPMEVLVDGQWWKVVEYKEVNSGIRWYFENRSTALIPHAETDERIKVKNESVLWS